MSGFDWLDSQNTIAKLTTIELLFHIRGAIGCEVA